MVTGEVTLLVSAGVDEIAESLLEEVEFAGVTDTVARSVRRRANFKSSVHILQSAK